MSWPELHAPPPPGTPLKCALAGGLVSDLVHTGVYLGRERVAELRGDGQRIAVTLSDFLNGSAGEWNPALLRTGFRIHAACDAASGEPISSSDAAARARERTTGRQELCRQEYDLLARNCHRFTAECISGRFDSPGDDPWMLDRLEAVISCHLNQGRAVCWRTVDPDTPGFRYAATPGKHLQRAGVVAGMVGVLAALGIGLRHKLAHPQNDQQG